MILEATDLTLPHFQKTLHRPLQIRVQPGEIVGILGGAGAGKTSLLRGILGLLPQQSGKIIFQGESFLPRHRRQIGYLPQDWGYIPEQTVEEFLQFYAKLFHFKLSEKTLVSMLELFDLAKQRGLALRFLEPKKRLWLGLARLLLLDPQLLLLDEPFEKLEEHKKREFYAMLQEMVEMQRSVLIASRSLESLQPICHRILFLAEGKFQNPEIFDLVQTLLQKTSFRLRPVAQKMPFVFQKVWNAPEIQNVYRVGTELVGSSQKSYRDIQKELKDLLGKDLASIQEWKKTPEIVLAELKQARYLQFQIKSPEGFPIYEFLQKQKEVDSLKLDQDIVIGRIQGCDGRKLLSDSLIFQGFTNFQVLWSVVDEYYR